MGYHEYMESSDFVRTNRFGAVDEDRTAVGLVTLYDSENSGLLGVDPALQRYAPEGDEFKKYLAIENDFGTRALAAAVARKIDAATNSKLRIDVTNVNLPLGIIDVNVLDIEAAVRNIFAPGQRKNIESILDGMHRTALGALDQWLERLLPSAPLVSLHSCSPGERIEHPDESNNLSDLVIYNKSFTTPKNQQKTVRSIDVVTALPNGCLIADPDLTLAIAGALSGSFPIAYNSPFSIQPGTWQLHAARDHKFVALDVPKHHFAHGSKDAVVRGLADLRVKGEKLEKLAGVIADGIVRAL